MPCTTALRRDFGPRRTRASTTVANESRHLSWWGKPDSLLINALPCVVKTRTASARRSCSDVLSVAVRCVIPVLAKSKTQPGPDVWGGTIPQMDLFCEKLLHCTIVMKESRSFDPRLLGIDWRDRGGNWLLQWCLECYIQGLPMIFKAIWSSLVGYLFDCYMSHKICLWWYVKYINKYTYRYLYHYISNLWFYEYIIYV